METRKDLFSGDICFSTVSDESSIDFVVTKSGGSYRLRNGRFASKVDAFIDKYGRRIKWLEYERAKYIRAWQSAVSRLCAVERENARIKSALRDIVDGKL